MIKGSEEACEEENFGSNKENHTVAKAFLDRGCVVALECSLSNNVSSSLIYC